MARSLIARRPYITLGTPMRRRIGPARVTPWGLALEAGAVLLVGGLLGLIAGCMAYGALS